MIDLYYWGTPNGLKARLALEEMELAYTIHPVNIGRGQQFEPDFLRISPNNKIPAIVDHAPVDGGEAITLFESGAILLYLAEKTGRLLSRDLRVRATTLEWLFWQIAGLGPMAGQAGHFRIHAPEQVPYGIDRYTREVARLYGVLDRRLEGSDYLVDDYSIADIACYPWIVPHDGHGQNLGDYPNVKRWFDAIAKRPAVVRAYVDAKDPYAKNRPPMSDAERAVLFGKR